MCQSDYFTDYILKVIHSSISHNLSKSLIKFQDDALLDLWDFGINICYASFIFLISLGTLIQMFD